MPDISNGAHTRIPPVTVYLQVDEWYPVWKVKLGVEGGEEMGDPIVVEEHVAARWRRAQYEYLLVQEEIKLAAAREGITA